VSLRPLEEVQVFAFILFYGGMFRTVHPIISHPVNKASLNNLLTSVVSAIVYVV
jgi:hypothetical protein